MLGLILIFIDFRTNCLSKDSWVLGMANFSKRYYSLCNGIENLRETRVQNKLELIEKYCHSLKANDYKAVISLFTEDGLVLSPLLGLLPHQDFYQKLFDTTYRDRVDIKNCFLTSQVGNSIAAHLTYTGGKNRQPPESLEFVDIFNLDSRNKIEKLTIFRNRW